MSKSIEKLSMSVIVHSFTSVHGPSFIWIFLTITVLTWMHLVPAAIPAPFLELSHESATKYQEELMVFTSFFMHLWYVENCSSSETISST